jgi:hypothetical protein
MKLGLANAPIDPEVIIYGRIVADVSNKYNAEKTDLKRPPVDFLKGPEPILGQPAQVVNSSITELLTIDQRQKSELQTVFVDIETTGLEYDDEIIEIAIVDDHGKVLLNSLVNCNCEIHPGAFKKHSISKDMLIKAPTLNDLEEEIIRSIKGKRVISYKVSFDLRFFPDRIRRLIASESCCMLEFADYYGKAPVWVIMVNMERCILFLLFGQGHEKSERPNAFFAKKT